MLRHHNNDYRYQQSHNLDRTWHWTWKKKIIMIMKLFYLSTIYTHSNISQMNLQKTNAGFCHEKNTKLETGFLLWHFVSGKLLLCHFYHRPHAETAHPVKRVARNTHRKFLTFAANDINVAFGSSLYRYITCTAFVVKLLLLKLFFVARGCNASGIIISCNICRQYVCGRGRVHSTEQKPTKYNIVERKVCPTLSFYPGCCDVFHSQKSKYRL